MKMREPSSFTPGVLHKRGGSRSGLGYDELHWLAVEGNKSFPLPLRNGLAEDHGVLLAPTEPPVVTRKVLKLHFGKPEDFVDVDARMNNTECWEQVLDNQLYLLQGVWHWS